MKNFAERLKELRKEKGLSKLAMAKSLQISDAAIGRWERGERTINAELLIKLADFFDVSVDYLLGRTDD
ncbi:MAG: helix-turn-helix domain-containing protein [Firmicutes bacterium]|nr:helix-turn-helix domain-containing protein [Bacillota bacterium]